MNSSTEQSSLSCCFSLNLISIFKIILNNTHYIKNFPSMRPGNTVSRFTSHTVTISNLHSPQAAGFCCLPQLQLLLAKDSPVSQERNIQLLNSQNIHTALLFLFLVKTLQAVHLLFKTCNSTLGMFFLVFKDFCYFNYLLPLPTIFKLPSYWSLPSFST